ncbi:MAG TPA: hypothetical protein VGG98_04185 [Solirubrobacteraceae bacterium]|jgi:hypothetical protein
MKGKSLNGFVVALSALTALTALLTGGVGEAMAVEWRLNGQALPVNRYTPVNIETAVEPTIKFSLGMGAGEEKFTLKCTKSNGIASLLGGSPGTDKIDSLGALAANCKVTRKIGLVQSEPCKVTGVSKVGNRWGSALSVNAGKFLDTLEGLELQFTLANNPPEPACTIIGALTIEGTAFVGEYQNAFQKWVYESATNPKFAGVAATLTWDYVFSTQRMSVRVALNGGAPQWQLSKAFLEATEDVGVVNEAKSVEIVDKKLGLTLVCKKVNGSGLAEGVSSKSPGTGLDVIELGLCEVSGEKACKVGEPVVLSTKTKLTSLEKEEFGLELAAKEGTTIGSITLSSASEKEICAKKGTYKLTGDTVGKVNNATEELEFTSPAQKGSALKLAESEAILVGKIKNTEGGTVAAN